MADIRKAIELLKEFEFSNDNTKLLHKNDTEDGLTYFGIYQSANPEWKGWEIINRYLSNEPDLKKCSVILSNVSDLNKLVETYIKRKYWDYARLDEVYSQQIANEIFIFGFNVGIKTAVKKAQKLVGVLVDGDVGRKTLEALNNYNELKFDKLFDEEEKDYYDAIIAKNQKLAKYKNGWYNRAEKV